MGPSAKANPARFGHALSREIDCLVGRLCQWRRNLFVVHGFGGRIRNGPGIVDHNEPWSWHIDPEVNIIDARRLQLQPDAARTCSDVENRLSYWLNGNGNFMPAAPSTIVAFLDRRLTPGPPPEPR